MIYGYGTQYVCGFVYHDNDVLLIEKQRPSWQHGLWNGIGGKIEPGETAEQAMHREFTEETGAVLDYWEHFATLLSEQVAIDFFRSFPARVPHVTQTTDERPAWWRQHELPPTLPNLNWLIPMGRHEVAGRGLPFTIYEHVL